jgi:uncharacterized protein YbgA (DUF1722 family)/uncharacterized protein YbbK (DUF523 family)
MTSPNRNPADTQRIRIGISACLLGDEVRYDGGHKRDIFLTDTLGKLVEWVKVCPEVESGMGTPREPIRLVAQGRAIRLRGVTSDRDYTTSMIAYSAAKMAALSHEDLCGYVLKRDSPSCGMTRVKVYGSKGRPSRAGVGLFAQALLVRFPHLPVEDEVGLADPRLRENFIERVFAFRRLRDLFGSRWTAGDLVRFHTTHKLALLAHSTPASVRLGRVVAGAKGADRSSLRARYTTEFMDALKSIATRRRHANVLQHMAGYFRKTLDATSRTELSALIEDYRRGLIPLIVPVTLIRHHVRVHDVPYLASQVYLAPQPYDSMRRLNAKDTNDTTETFI